MCACALLFSLIRRCTIRSFWCSIINKCSTIFQLNRCVFYLFIYIFFVVLLYSINSHCFLVAADFCCCCCYCLFTISLVVVFCTFISFFIVIVASSHSQTIFFSPQLMTFFPRCLVIRTSVNTFFAMFFNIICLTLFVFTYAYNVWYFAAVTDYNRLTDMCVSVPKNEEWLDEMTSDQTRPGQTKPNQTKPD